MTSEERAAMLRGWDISDRVPQDRDDVRKVRLTLVGLDGNAFALLGAFQRAARRQGVPEDELKAIIADAKSGDYDHLVRVLILHTVDEEEGGSE